jgi:hypothetical protein
MNSTEFAGRALKWPTDLDAGTVKTMVDERARDATGGLSGEHGEWSRGEDGLMRRKDVEHSADLP